MRGTIGEEGKHMPRVLKGIPNSWIKKKKKKGGGVQSYAASGQIADLGPLSSRLPGVCGDCSGGMILGPGLYASSPQTNTKPWPSSVGVNSQTRRCTGPPSGPTIPVLPRSRP